MKYCASIHYQRSDMQLKDFQTWSEVTDFLKRGLNPNVIRVYVYKFDSRGRELMSRCVTMGNLIEVATAKTDKEALI